MEHLLQQLLGLGCSMLDPGDAQLRTVERDRCAPEDFYSTTNHRTLIRHEQQWLEVENQRMDALVVVENGRAFCRRLRDVRAGDEVVQLYVRHPGVVRELQGFERVPLRPGERKTVDFALRDVFRRDRLWRRRKTVEERQPSAAAPTKDARQTTPLSFPPPISAARPTPSAVTGGGNR